MTTTCVSRSTGKLLPRDRNRSVGFSLIGDAGWLTLICGLLLTACNRQPEKAAPPPPPPPPEVVTVTVAPQPLVLTVELPGHTSAFRSTQVLPQAGGVVINQLFAEGSVVKTGQVLYEIDSDPLQTALASAEENLAAQRKAADRARATLTASIASVTQQKATVALAHANRQRVEGLFKDKAISSGDSDQAVTGADLAEVTLKAAEARVQRNQAAVATAEAAVHQANADLESLRSNLRYTQIKAPVSGRISKSAVTNGTLVSADQTLALATIQQIDPIYVDVPQAIADLRLQHRLEEGEMNRDGATDSVQLLMEDDTKYRFEGTVLSLGAAAEPTTGAMILRLVFPNPKGLLQPGMTVRAVVKNGFNEHAILIPRQAVSRTPKGEPMALIVDGEGIVQRRMLALNRILGDQWLVSSGLQPGDRVIADGAQKLAPGAKVNAVAFASFSK